MVNGDMMSVDGDADAAVEARIRIGWNKFRQYRWHSIGTTAEQAALVWVCAAKRR